MKPVNLFTRYPEFPECSVLLRLALMIRTKYDLFYFLVISG